jgi:phosphatidate cytidylyltransferase
MNWKRLATAIVLIPLLILYVMKLPAVFYTGLISITCAVALIEFFTMYGVRGALKTAGVIVGAAVPVGVYMGYHVDALLAAFLVVSSIRLFQRPEPKGSLSDLAPVVFGLVYISGLMGFHITLRNIEPGMVIFLYGTVWLADASAYYFGKTFGTKKLYPSMSPKKTIVGGVASVLGGSAGACIMKSFLLPLMSYATVAVLGLIIGGVTIVGDLVESMLKRDAGVKDSGALIPGHGGILDKIDGSIFAGSVLYWSLLAMGLV